MYKRQPEKVHTLLAPRLAGRTNLLLGQSGMGKSTLLNALVPDAAAPVSYTHLDVYKRQPEASANFWCRIIGLPNLILCLRYMAWPSWQA